MKRSTGHTGPNAGVLALPATLAQDEVLESESVHTPGRMILPALVNFDDLAWTRQCLPRSAGNICGRLALITLGTLFASGCQPVSPRKISELTGMAESLIDDVLTEAVDNGVVSVNKRGFYSPVQVTSEESKEAQARHLIELQEECTFCLAPVGQPCVSIGGKYAWTNHAYRKNWARAKGEGIKSANAQKRARKETAACP